MKVTSNEFGEAVCKALGVDPGKVSELHIRAIPGAKLQVHLIMHADESIMEAVSKITPEQTEVSTMKMLKAGI